MLESYSNDRYSGNEDIKSMRSKSEASLNADDLIQSRNVNICKQFWLLFKRNCTYLGRNSMLSFGFLLVAVIVGLLMGAVFQDIGTQTFHEVPLEGETMEDVVNKNAQIQ